MKDIFLYEIIYIYEVGTHAYYRLALVSSTAEENSHARSLINTGGSVVKKCIFSIYYGTGVAPLCYVIVDGLCNVLNGLKNRI